MYNNIIQCSVLYYGPQRKIRLKYISKNYWNPTYCGWWCIFYYGITRHAGTLWRKKMGSLPVQSLYVYILCICIYITTYIPKWTTIRSKCAFKLLHVCTRWIHVRVYHNNGFFLRKKTILPPTKERNKSRYTEKKNKFVVFIITIQECWTLFSRVICSPLTRRVQLVDGSDD
jgi:hypothetical protein